MRTSCWGSRWRLLLWAIILPASGFLSAGDAPVSSVPPALHIPLGPLGAHAQAVSEGEGSAGEAGRLFRIVATLPGGPAQRAGWAAGDLISLQDPSTEPGMSPLRQLMELAAAAQGSPQAIKDRGASLSLAVKRGERQEIRIVKLPATGPHASSCPANCPACQGLLASSLDWLAAQGKGYRAPRSFDLLDRGPFYVGRIVNGMKTAQSRPYTVAVTAVAGLAFLAAGESPTQGPHAALLAGCRDYVAMSMQTWQIPAAQAGGEIEQDYENWALGYAGLFLSECLARGTKDLRLGKTLEWIAKRLGENQEESGGWGHKPHVPNRLGYREFTAPGLVILPALSLIKERGLAVPEKALAKGVEYLRKVQEETGAFCYGHDRGGLTHVGRTGGALFALALAGAPKDAPEFQLTAAFFLAHPEHALYGHGSQMMNLVWSGWGAAAAGTVALQQTWVACRYIAWAARQPDGSFAPWPRQEIAYTGNKSCELPQHYDADTEKYLGAGEPKAVAVWIAAHHLIFWQTPQRKLSWLKLEGTRP